MKVDLFSKTDDEVSDRSVDTSCKGNRLDALDGKGANFQKRTAMVYDCKS